MQGKRTRKNIRAKKAKRRKVMQKKKNPSQAIGEKKLMETDNPPSPDKICFSDGPSLRKVMGDGAGEQKNSCMQGKRKTTNL